MAEKCLGADLYGRPAKTARAPPPPCGLPTPPGAMAQGQRSVPALLIHRFLRLTDITLNLTHD